MKKKILKNWERLYLAVYTFGTKRFISDTMNYLTPKEKEILKLRFGLEDGMMFSLDEVAKLFGVTRERIRQIESRAIDKLRENYGGTTEKTN